MSIDWTGYPLHGLLETNDIIFNKLWSVNQKVITFDSQGENCDKENGHEQIPYIYFFANKETVDKILGNSNQNIDFYYYLNDSNKKLPDENVVLTIDNYKPFSILNGYKYYDKRNFYINFFDNYNSTDLYVCHLVYNKSCEKGSFLKLIDYLNKNSVGEEINKKEYESKKNDIKNKLKNLKKTISYIRFVDYKNFIQRVERLTNSGLFEKYKDDLIEEIHRLINIHNKKYKDLLDFKKKYSIKD